MFHVKHAWGKRCGRVSSIDRAGARLRLDRGSTVVGGAGRFACSFRGAQSGRARRGAQAGTRRGNARSRRRAAHAAGGGASRCAAGSARPRRRAVRSARERAVACAQVLHVGGSRACSAQVRRQSLPTRAFMMPDTMLMTMDATNALPNVAMSMPTWKIPLASHAATYSMSAFTTR